MTGLFTGIIGSLIGAGIQSTIGGIPIREDASKALEVLRVGGLPVPPANWFSIKSSEEQSTEQVYDKTGQHVPSAMQILGPCMQIAEALKDVAYTRSQLTTAKPWTPQAELPRSTASYKLAGVNDPATLLLPGMAANINRKKECNSGCLHSCEATSSTNKSVNSQMMKDCKPRKDFYPESIRRIDTRKMKKPAENLGNRLLPNDFCRVQETAIIPVKGNLKNEANSLVKDKTVRTVIGKEGKTDPRERATKENELTVKVEISKDFKCHPSCCSSMVTNKSSLSEPQKNMCKPRNKSVKSDKSEKFGICQICQVLIQKPKKKSFLPCGHGTLCYRCLKGKNLLKCPECGMKFNRGSI